MNWYFAVEGHSHGPVTEQDLADLARDGEVGTDTLIWHPGLEEWEPVWKLRPQIMEQLDKQAMARQEKGATDRVPLPAKGITDRVPLPAMPPRAESTGATSSGATSSGATSSGATSSGACGGILQRMFGKRRKK